MPTPLFRTCRPPCLLLTLLLGLKGVTSQELQVTQPEASVWVLAGETATLTCTITSLLPVGPVKWFRWTGPGWELIYSFKGGDWSRVTAVADVTRGDNTDFSIRLRDVTQADAGVYYCVKFQNGSPEDVEFRSGPGTKVTVSEPEMTVPFFIAVLLGLLLGPKVLLVVGVSIIYNYVKEGP